MRKAILGVIVIASGLWWSIGASLAFDINLSPSNVGFNNPTGIDFQDTTGKLILSVNYPTGSPNTLELADPVTGTSVPFSSLANLTNEVEIATVRSGSCQGGFTDGEVFAGNGTAGQIVRISADGTSVQ